MKIYKNSEVIGPQIFQSRLTVVSREAKEEIPYDSFSMNAREYFTGKNLVKIKNAITYEHKILALYNST